MLPNLLVSAHPDYVLTHRLEPLAPGATRIECEWLAEPGADIDGAVELTSFDLAAEWDTVARILDFVETHRPPAPPSGRA